MDLVGPAYRLTDLPLTEQGERTARRLGDRLKGLTFTKVFTSPLQRARQTCELAGFGPLAEIDPDLVEWDYGKYEGRRGAEIRAERPHWDLFLSKQQIFHVEHGEPQCLGLRKRSPPAGDPILERHSRCGH